MHLFQPPFSLISFLVLLASSAVIPVDSLELSLDNFSKRVENGLWFIEHFSPYCGHCKHFKPTWEQLVDEAKTEIPEVNLAIIDCIMNSDLCDQNGVQSYPSLLMFQDGKKLDEFRGPRDLESLKSFMKRHVKEAAPPPPPPPPSPPPPPAPPKQPPKPVLNPVGEVTVLNSEKFSSILSKGPTFVKFFAPWCGHCKKLAPVWKQLAKHMQGKVTIAEVNCEDHASLCKSQDVEGYPTLVWYGQGDDESARSEYKGGRKLDLLRAFVDRASSAGVQILEKADELYAHVKDDPVVYLLLHSASDSQLISTVREASASLLGSPQVFASSDSALMSHFGVSVSPSSWAIVAIKDHDMLLPASTFHGGPNVDKAKLKRWLLTHRLPSFLELTQDSFQNTMNAPQAPFVVIVPGPESHKDKIMSRLRDTGKKWTIKTEGSGIVHGKEVVFAWMNSEKWGKWMKDMYGIKLQDDYDLDDTTVIIADHRRLIYYDSDRDGNPTRLSPSTPLFSAIEDAAEGKSSYKNSENLVERTARYLSAKFSSLEYFISTRPFQSVFIAVFFVVAIVWLLNRMITSDVEDNFRESKGRNGRLD